MSLWYLLSSCGGETLSKKIRHHQQENPEEKTKQGGGIVSILQEGTRDEEGLI